LDIIEKIKKLLKTQGNYKYPDSFINKTLTHKQLKENICLITSIKYSVENKQFIKEDIFLHF